MANKLFKAGVVYVAGIDKPFIAPVSAIKSGVEDMGFQVLDFWECAKRAPLPYPVPGKCDDDWDYIGVVKKLPPSKTIDVPSQVKWIREEKPPAPQPQPTPPPPPGPGPAPPPAPPGPGPAPPPAPPPPPPPEIPVTPQSKLPASMKQAELGSKFVWFGLGIAAGWLGWDKLTKR
ncbi:MAG: hypothetical protein ACYTFN_14755 [Planctomycetota bacterium]|jgi:hypothetical protein